jgi:hypothetical protein
VRRQNRFFQGSELSRLVVLSAIMVAGWTAAWLYARQTPELPEHPLAASDSPEPIVADRSEAFETVADRTPMSFRDNAAYSLLLARARGESPAGLAALTRRDVFLTHLWERPDQYRGVPVHIQGSALRVLRYESKLSQNGWLYEAWIITPEATRVPYVCVFEDAPKGLPIGTDISERVVFNGYFLKIMKYDATDVARGAPVLIGRIGWAPHESSRAEGPRISTTLRWSLIALGALFCVSLLRWIFQLRRLFAAPRPIESPRFTPTDQLEPGALDAWVQAVAQADEPDSS